MSAAIVAFGALSGLGRGREAASAGEPGAAARVATVQDDELTAAGLARPFCSRVADLGGEGDRATRLLASAMAACMSELDRDVPGWRERRVGLALGTSSGGMREAEVLFRTLHEGKVPSADQARRSMYFSPMADVVQKTGMVFSPSTLILTACAASTVALGLGMRWLEAGACDVVLAGGFDAVSVFVASGFEALRATTSQLPSRPFCIGRDGMALGEGAAILALARPSEAPRAMAYLTGFGASGDAVHVTAPDRTGEGLARAAKRARAEANDADITLVSAHGTATPFNDAAESRAIRAAMGDAAVVVHPFKAQIGHTLGAAGALETLTCVDAILRGVLPASVIGPDRDPDAPATLLEHARKSDVAAALKLSAAFGGANAALVIERDLRRRARPGVLRPVFLSRGAHVSEAPSLPELAASVGQAADRLAKACDLSRLALAAIARLRAEVGDLQGAGIVVGHAYATLDVNYAYNRRILERGARLVEPRKFPYTSPNGCAGECSVAFGLVGPNIALGSGLHGGLEALVVASHLVAAGDADRIVVVAVDAPGPAARAVSDATGWPLPPVGAVAVLVSKDAFEGGWRLGACALTSAGLSATCVGHQALLPLCHGWAGDEGALRRIGDARPQPQPTTLHLVSGSPGAGLATAEVDPCL